MMRVGLLADTHIPYRATSWSPGVLAALRGVDAILHAGDVDEPWALDALREIAPVYAVRGNAHWFDGSSGGASLPDVVRLALEGFDVVVTHGHLRGWPGIYWRARMVARALRRQWDFPAYDRVLVQQLLQRFPQADVIVFGHTHRFYTARVGQTLVINPGAALATAYFGAPYPPSIAHLILRADHIPQVRKILCD